MSSMASGELYRTRGGLGQISGEQVEVMSGVRPGNVVATEGSFFVRAERERFGLRAPASMSRKDADARVQHVKSNVNEPGYERRRSARRDSGRQTGEVARGPWQASDCWGRSTASAEPGPTVDRVFWCFGHRLNARRQLYWRALAASVSWP